MLDYSRFVSVTGLVLVSEEDVRKEALIFLSKYKGTLKRMDTSQG